MTFFAAGVMSLLLDYDITAPAPPNLPAGAKPNLLTGTVLFFNNERQRFGQEVISGCLFVAGFVALVAVVIVFARRRGFSDMSDGVMAGFFAIGGTLGAASILLELGAKQNALGSEICDCKYSATQIISQGRSLVLADGSSDWLLYGFLALAAVGFAVAALSSYDPMGPSWRTLSGVISALLIVGLIAISLDLSDLSDLITGVGGGILIPIWAIWTGHATQQIAARKAHA